MHVGRLANRELPVCGVSQGDALVMAFHTTCLYAGPTQDGPHATWKIISKAIDELHSSLESRPGESAMAEDPAGLKVSQGRLKVQRVALQECPCTMDGETPGGCPAECPPEGSFLPIMLLWLPLEYFLLLFSTEKKVQHPLFFS